MAQLEGIQIKNYRALRDVTLGRTFESQRSDPLPKLIAAVGPNGCGKTSLLDVCGFIGDCLSLGVEDACDQSHRGGFERLRTRGQDGPISFEIYYRHDLNSRPISYSLSIDLSAEGRPYVAYERLRQRRKGQSRGRPFSFLERSADGSGFAWAGESTGDEEGRSKIDVELEDPQRLGITTLGNLADHPRIVAFREFLEGWYLSYFVPDLARKLPAAGVQKHLNRQGDNLANYVQYMERSHGQRFKRVLNGIAAKIPGIKSIHHKRSDDGRILLQFNESGYVDPFYQADMSDGSLKMFAYLLLLEDPDPAPLIGIEEPENGLHHQLLSPFATAIQSYVRERKGPQVLLTTHSPYLVDALRPEEVWVLQKDSAGFTEVRRAADIAGISDLFDTGLPLGSLWYSNHFGVGNP